MMAGFSALLDSTFRFVFKCAAVHSALRLTLAAMLMAAAAGVAAQEARLAPADEAAGDITWLRFKARLFNALARHDQKTLLEVTDGRIRNISGKNGVAEFRKLWQPQSSDSPIWSELPKLLSLGGVLVKSAKGPAELCAPYVRFKWPADAAADADGAILSRDALLKLRPSADSETEQTLSYNLVKVLDWDIADERQGNQQRWVRVQTKNGAGYVPEEQIRSPFEHHACFVKRGGTWHMIAFAVGE
jgi:hypothetical protein